ncbi:protein phosphatase 1 regulatory subunit 37 [Neltuma alba]|uniref:protein phosphatase 1 regulatory subunit 37 n=1 Tax=Neltuma alba TaxID=207710 RepID=UPI0010A55014|nr:protein phosphatase 1 regulatory subunit 37-like [Prosopis alba]
MSMLDSFFAKGFKGSKCKTLLKLTIPRIKLLRNRREIQLKQMRRDIAKLLETGQEATARIRVEHIVREENMMAAQEIIELFCELIAVRLPIIESQRECPLDLKEAISSVCFAAPRCADLPELLQVQMLFASKYGKEFISAATELMPDCGVNRQLIELLSIRAPSPEKKLTLLKEIAVEHDVDWDPTASEAEFLKKHEDLLNGPTQFFSGSKVPLPEEKHNEALYSAPDQPNKGEPDSDSDSDVLEFPEVPKVSVRSSANFAMAPETVTSSPSIPPPEVGLHSSSSSGGSADIKSEYTEEKSMVNTNEPHDFAGSMEKKQFVPFISPPMSSDGSFSARHSDSPPSLSKTTAEADVDLNDVLVAAHTAAETAERAAAAARSAATLAQIRINELTKKSGENVPDGSSENPFYTGNNINQSRTPETGNYTEQKAVDDYNGHGASSYESPNHQNAAPGSDSSRFTSFDTLKPDLDSCLPEDKTSGHQPKRLPSMDEDPYFSYPNLFTSQNSNAGSLTQLDNTRSHHEF